MRPGRSLSVVSVLYYARVTAALHGVAAYGLALTPFREPPREAEGEHIAHVAAVHAQRLADVAVKQFGVVGLNAVLETMLPVERQVEIADAVRGRNVPGIRAYALGLAFEEAPAVVYMGRQRLATEVRVAPAP